MRGEHCEPPWQVSGDIIAKTRFRLLYPFACPRKGASPHIPTVAAFFVRFMPHVPPVGDSCHDRPSDGRLTTRCDSINSIKSWLRKAAGVFFFGGADFFFAKRLFFRYGKVCEGRALRATVGVTAKDNGGACFPLVFDITPTIGRQPSHPHRSGFFCSFHATYVPTYRNLGFMGGWEGGGV